MGQMIARLNEKYFSGEDYSKKQESKGMLHDVTADESDLNITDQFGLAEGDMLNATTTPPNVLKLKCDPRSPSNFDRTPLKVPLED